MSNAFIAQQDDESVLLKMQTIRILIAVTLKYTQLYSLYRQSSYAIFRPILNAVNSLPVENYPSCLAADLDNLKAALDSACESKALTQMKVQPRRQEKTRQITFLEPRVEEHFNPERPRKESGGKKGNKGAAKELRMDAKYIAKIQDERNSKVSRERKEKTNRIMQGLQSQESEYKKRTAKKF
uniref:Uncharacterized protein n=1 Tax=Ditylenchus dipsaci TaxID=166011 RepID=A0A915E6C7_9BILA